VVEGLRDAGVGAAVQVEQVGGGVHGGSRRHRRRPYTEFPLADRQEFR
jgi:hypothetical protein